MNKFKSITFRAFILVAVLIPLSGCDFDAARDSFDDFDIIIGLDPINTVVNGIIYDNASGDLMDNVQLSFSGNGASSLIDAYSDPIGSSNNVEGGTITFGIQNSVVPTAGNPLTFVVTATAEGFYDQSRTVQVTETGAAEFEVAMVRVADTFSDIQGSSAVQSSVQVDQGGLQNQFSVSTQGGGSQAHATVTIAPGVVPLTSSGAAITGSLDTQLRVYDPSQGQTNLPAGATMASDGSHLAVAAGAFFQMSSGGSVVANFVVPVGKAHSANKSGTCSAAGGFFEIELAITDPTILAAHAVIVAAGGTPAASIYGFTPTDGQNNVLGSTILTSSSGNVTGLICVGGSESNVDLTALGNVDDGIFFTLVFPPSLGSNGSLNQMLTLSNAGASTPAAIQLDGAGLFGFRSITVPTGSSTKSLASWLGLSGSFFILNGATYTVSVELGDGSVHSTTTTDPSAGSSTISLPASTGLTAFSFTASMECPADQEFEVQVTSESLDAVGVFYRRNQDGSLWRSIPDAALTTKTATASSILVQGTLSLLPSTSYIFRGVLDDNSSERIETTPSTATTWVIELDADDVGFGCDPG